jgi:hypothetical protein
MLMTYLEGSEVLFRSAILLTLNSGHERRGRLLYAAAEVGAAVCHAGDRRVWLQVTVSPSMAYSLSVLLLICPTYR